MTLLISDEEVRAHYTMARCVEAVEAAFEAAGRSGFDVTERKVVAVEGGARLLSLTAASPELSRLVANIYTGAPAGHDKRTSPVNRRQKLYLLFDTASGACEAIIGGAYLAWLKTGAMGAVAIKHLARPSARRLCVLGSGRQARAALTGALTVRDFEDVRVWSRTPGNATRLLEGFPQISNKTAVSSAHEAVEGADVVITTTTSTDPILEGDWLEAGCHVNSIGAHYPSYRELNGEAVRRSSVFVDTLVAATAEKGELIIAEREGLFSFENVVAELGEVVAEGTSWRRSEGEITLFASCGSAIESLGAAGGALAAMPAADRVRFSF